MKKQSKDILALFFHSMTKLQELNYEKFCCEQMRNLAPFL